MSAPPERSDAQRDPDGPVPAPRPAPAYARPLTVLPPSFVPMTAEQEQQAVHALADLLADWWDRRQHQPPPSNRPGAGEDRAA